MRVIEDIESTFGTSSPAFIQMPDGNYDPIRAAIRDGQRSVLLHMKQRIYDATHETKTPTQALK